MCLASCTCSQCGTNYSTWRSLRSADDLTCVVLACGTLFQSSRVIVTSPTDCSDTVLWLLICGTKEKHLLTYLPAFAGHTPHCCVPCSNRLISPANLQQWVCCCGSTLGHTDGHAPDRCTDPAPHRMQAVPIRQTYYRYCSTTPSRNNTETRNCAAVSTCYSHRHPFPQWLWFDLWPRVSACVGLTLTISLLSLVLVAHKVFILQHAQRERISHRKNWKQYVGHSYRQWHG